MLRLLVYWSVAVLQQQSDHRSGRETEDLGAVSHRKLGRDEPLLLSASVSQFLHGPKCFSFLNKEQNPSHIACVL